MSVHLAGAPLYHHWRYTLHLSIPAEHEHRERPSQRETVQLKVPQLQKKTHQQKQPLWLFSLDDWLAFEVSNQMLNSKTNHVLSRQHSPFRAVIHQNKNDSLVP